jgi:hypothetical protein
VWLILAAGSLVAQTPQPSLTATNVAPSKAFDGKRCTILRLTFGNPTGSGVATAQLTSFGLLFEESAGTPLTVSGAESLFAAVEIYEDTNASGALEPVADTLIAEAFSLPVAFDGTINWTLENSDPADLQVASGGSRNYIVSVTLGSSASSGAPKKFRVTHLANGPARSTVRDAVTGNTLALAGAPNVTSSLVTATFNTPPTTTGIGDVLAFDANVPAVVTLFASFQDAEDLSSQLTYAVTADANPALFSFVGIDPTTGVLSLDFANGTSGQSQLTVTATDSGGKSVAASFTVRVAPFTTFAQFSNLILGGSPAPLDLGAGIPNLLRYAFFLNSGQNGATRGLPRLERNGNARIFSHLRPKNATDLVYQYEISQDLVSWIPAVNDVHYYENQEDLGDGSVRVDLLLLMDWPQAFLRARVGLTTASGAAPAAAGLATAPVPPLSTALTASGRALPPPAPAVTATNPIHPSTVFPQETVVTTSQPYASSVVAVDLDRDGLVDLAAASLQDSKIAWYRNNGDGTFSAPHIVSTAAAGPTGLVAADLDGDGWMDLVSASCVDDEIAWYRNLGGPANGGLFGFNPASPAANQRLISRSADYAYSVCVADLNGDGLPDVISTSLMDNKVAWYRNLGGGNFGWSSATPAANQQIISTAGIAPSSVAAADLDGDGVIDLVVTSINDNTLAWLKGSNAGGILTFTRYVVSTTQMRAQRVAIADIDGDQRRDLLCAAPYGNKVTCFRNTTHDSNAAAPFFGPEYIISDMTRGASCVVAADLNADGRPDIVSSSLLDNKIAWYLNTGPGTTGSITFGPQQLVSSNALGAASVAAGDFNNDGKMEIASASQDDSKVSVFLNHGGQCALVTTDTATGGIREGERDDILRVAVSNRGLPGDENARLATLALLFEKSPGLPLSAVEANRLIDNLTIYADSNGSGAFESGVDQPIASVFYLALNAGKLTVSLQSSPAATVQIPAGATKNYFVVPQMTASAASQNPNQFRVTHLGHELGRSSVMAAVSGATLTIEELNDENVSSSIITATVNPPPTTIGILQIITDDPWLPTFIPLGVFSNPQPGPEHLSYALLGNSNPGLFDFVGIDANTGVLAIRYQGEVGGTANLTVQTTDEFGRSASATFAVVVKLADSFTHWKSLYFGGTLAATNPLDQRFGDGLSNLTRYAFALNPLRAGDRKGLPQLQHQGNCKVFTHLKPRWTSDLTYAYEVSEDLVTWVPALDGVHYHRFDHDLPNGVRQSDLVLLIKWPRAFLRVRTVLTN